MARKQQNQSPVAGAPSSSSSPDPKDDRMDVEDDEREKDAGSDPPTKGTTSTAAHESDGDHADDEHDDDDGDDHDEQKKDEKDAEGKDDMQTTSDDEPAGDKDGSGKGTAKKKEATKKTRTVDWPLREIKEPHPNDVLYGRGGGTNHHPGNKRYRKMVEERKIDYVNSKRLDKPLVALQIIREWRAQDPPGRFLKIDEKTSLWQDVGDKKAREKTSQALREKAPLIRKQQEEEEERKRDEKKGSSKGKKESRTKTTRFADGTNSGKKDGVKKAVLARDHSLGREYLEPDEAVTLDGFSWQDPFQNGGSRGVGKGPPGVGPAAPPPPPPQPSPDPAMPQTNSQGSSSGPAPPPPPGPPHGYPAGHYRYGSHGSGGPPPPGAPPPPPPPAAGPYAGRYESWGSLPPPPPPPAAGGPAPPPMPPPGYQQHHYSGSWSQSRESSSSQHPSQREHSLSHFPLPHASVSQPAPYAPFDSRSGSANWGPPPPVPMEGHHPPPPPAYHHYPGCPPPPHPAPYGAPPPGREYSSGHAAGGAPAPPPSHVRRRSGSSGPPSPPYEVDPAVASTWSGQGGNQIVKTLSGEEYDRQNRTDSKSVSSLSNSTPYGGGSSSSTSTAGSSGGKPAPPKPDVVKRSTSNQNETNETRPGLCGPSVKRCALNRDSSRASNRLKELCFPDQFKNGRFDTVREINELSQDMNRSTLTSPSPLPLGDGGRTSTLDLLPPPNPMTAEERTTTIENIAMDLMVKPVTLASAGRSSTIEALALDLEDDPLIGRGTFERHSTMEAVFDEFKEDLNMPAAPLEDLQKPAFLGPGDRVTTRDLYDMVNEPIADDDPELFSGKSKDKLFSFSAATPGCVEGV